MKREISRTRALANGFAVLIILGLAGWGLGQVAKRQWSWQETIHIHAEFDSIGGLEAGDRIRIQGIDAGVIEKILPPLQPGGQVVVNLRIDQKLRHLVRTDAKARITTEGVVGAKVIEIVPGRADAELLAEGGSIASERQAEISDLVRDAQSSMKRLDHVAEAAEESLGHINLIAGAIAKGEGSLGKFVRDDEAYLKLIGMTGRGEKALTELEENLSALKRTWPLSRYFTTRAYYDRERLLFQPGSDREIRTWPIETLFEPSRAVLTVNGKKTLDEVAGRFKQILRPKSSVVIAAYTDDKRDPELSQILTQEQADAVRRYLTERHSLETAGWFGTRKVASIGFGTEKPRVGPDNNEVGGPPKRLELIVFTPQT